MLWRAGSLQDCATDLEGVALLSLYRGRSLRAELHAHDRREHIAAAVERGGPLAEEDRWAAFNLSAGRADVPRQRGQVRDAAQYGHQAVAW